MLREGERPRPNNLDKREVAETQRILLLFLGKERDRLPVGDLTPNVAQRNPAAVSNLCHLEGNTGVGGASTVFNSPLQIDIQLVPISISCDLKTSHEL